MQGFVNYFGFGSNNATGGIEIYYKNSDDYLFFNHTNTSEFDLHNIFTRIYYFYIRRRIRNLFIRSHFDWYFQLFNSVKCKKKLLESIEVADSFGYGLIPYLLKIPYIVKLHTPHSIVWELNSWKKDLWYNIVKIIEKTAIKHAQKILSPSEAMIEYLMDNKWQIDVNKTFIVRNKISEEPLSYLKTEKKKQILFVGNLEPRKNLYFALKCFLKNSALKEYKLIICGVDSVYYEKKIKKNISYWNYCCENLPEIKNNPKIIYKGFVSNDDIAMEYINSEYLIVCSTGFENFPTTILEAFKYNTIVIGSRIGGIPELIENGKNGFLFEDNNSKSFTETIIKAVKCNKNKIQIEATKKLCIINNQIETPYINKEDS